MVLGVRGFPGVEGGVESHAEHLYPLLVERGCEVESLVRAAHVPKEIGDAWKGVHLRRLWAPTTRLPGVEALVHSFFGVVYAALRKPDLLHIHSIGPAIFCPLARLLGLRVVFTYHTQDYAREKWGLVGRLMLRTGEWLAVHFSNSCITVSKILQQRVRTRFHRECVHIPNGMEIAKPVPPGDTLKQFHLEPRRYVLMVSRLDPGKRHFDLMRAFALADLKGWKLVLVGGLNPTEQYVKRVIEGSKTLPGVILTGFQTGKTLGELYSNAGLFVLPSSHEGLPVVLLEALSYGLPTIASNIPANLSVGLPEDHYFPIGDVVALGKKLQQFSADWKLDGSPHRAALEIQSSCDWKTVADKTLCVYSSVVQSPV
jgi:glycosyltransferase involved in cell wall biosynthesis